MIYLSDRGIPLILETRHDCPVLTVESWCKWYRLFIIHPNGRVEPLAYDTLDLDEFRGRQCGYSDHCPNPHAVERYAESIGGVVDAVALDAITGRWVREGNKL